MDRTLLDLHFDYHFWTEHPPERRAEVHNIEPSEVRARLDAKLNAFEGELNWYDTNFWVAT